MKKNAIMMIDFALEAERDEGLPPEEAIHQACLLRFRPILMTTLAALFGACRWRSAGAAPSCAGRWASPSWAGCCVSQLLTLFTTPVIYLFLDRLRRDRAAEYRTQTVEAEA